MRVTARKGLELQEGRVELVYENEYTYRESSRSSTGASSSSSYTTERTTKTDRKVVAEQRFLEPGRVPAGTPLEHTVELTIPAEAPPSAPGKITKVRWKVVATLARPRARDVHGEAKLEVLSPRASRDPEAPDVDSHGDCELELRLDRTHFGPGDEVAGTLVANPLRDCKLNEVRVELVRHEEVPRALGNEEDVQEAEATLDGAIELTASLPREWPFRLVLPLDLVPCLRTDQSRITWALKGIGSRRMRSDYRVEQPLDVHSAPSRPT